MTKNLTTALFPVAGIGRRLLPMTKAVPKELLPVGGLPLIQYAVNEAKAAGVERFIFITGDNLSQLESYFSPNPRLEKKLCAQKATEELALLKELILDQMIFIPQTEPLGLGHAIGCAAKKISERFAVLLPDDLLAGSPPPLVQMEQALQNKNLTDANAVAIEKVPMGETSRYGIMAVEKEEGALVKAAGVVEKPATNPPSELALIGRYILQPSIFSWIEKVSRGAGEEIQITDAMDAACAEHSLYGYRYDGERFDCGTKEAFIETQKNFGAINV